jgi:hypothetical protein
MVSFSVALAWNGNLSTAFAGDLLSKLVSILPEWWTPTAQVKAVVGLILDVRFAHSFGVPRGHLTGNYVLLDNEGLIQAADFSITGLRYLDVNEIADRDADGMSRAISSAEEPGERSSLPLFFLWTD